MEFLGRTLGRTVEGELARVVGPEFHRLGSAHHGAVEENRLVVAADDKTMPDAQTVVGWLKGDLHDLAFFYPNHRRVIFPRPLNQFDPQVRLAELFPDSEVLRCP